MPNEGKSDMINYLAPLPEGMARVKTAIAYLRMTQAPYTYQDYLTFCHKYQRQPLHRSDYEAIKNNFEWAVAQAKEIGANPVFVEDPLP